MPESCAPRTKPRTGQSGCQRTSTAASGCLAPFGGSRRPKRSRLGTTQPALVARPFANVLDRLLSRPKQGNGKLLVMTDQPLMEFSSHVAGANAKVAIYPDRIEWGRRGYKPAGGVTAAVLTGGLSLALPGRRDTNMIPVRQIQGVTTHRAGLSYTTVRVATAGDTTEFRVTKAQAENIKALLIQLMSGPGPHAAGPPTAPSASPTSVADELRKLAELRDAGVLSDEEIHRSEGTSPWLSSAPARSSS